VIEAAAQGASIAIGLVANIGANLIAFFAFLAFINAILSYLGSLVLYPELSFEVSPYPFSMYMTVASVTSPTMHHSIQPATRPNDPFINFAQTKSYIFVFPLRATRLPTMTVFLFILNGRLYYITINTYMYLCVIFCS
jgi:hypothetical protein